MSTWAGHSSAAFTADRYQHLFEDRDDDLADRLDVLLEARRSRHRADVRELPQSRERQESR